MVVVDTSVWIDYLNRFDTPETVWLDRALGRQRLGLLDITLADVLGCAPDERQAADVERALLKFEVFETGGADLASTVGLNERALRRHGLAIRKATTCWVATFCMLNDLALLHNDRDFDPFERDLWLTVVHADRDGLGPRER